MKTRNVVLLIAVVLTIGITYVLRAVNPPEPAQPGIGTNIALLSEDLSRIDNGGGKYTLVFQTGQNYMKDGVVYPFDLSIRNSEAEGFDYEVVNKVRLLLSRASDGAYRIEHEGDYAEFELANVTSPVTGANAEGMLRFSDVFPHMDVVQRPVNLGLKETVVLKNAAASPVLSTYMRTNLTPEPMADGSIFLMSGEAPIFLMPAPSAEDANGIPFRAAYNLAPAGNDFSITLSVDLDSAGIAPAYPVEIDPTITFNNPSTIKDALVSGEQDSYNYNYGANVALLTGFFHGSHIDSDRTFIEFTAIADSLPSGAEILSATLKLKCYYAQKVNSSFNIQLYKITKDWDEGNQTAGVGYCNWVSAKSGDAWSKLGGDYGEKIDTTCHRGDSAWYEFNVTDAVQAWVDSPGSNYGILLKDSLEGSGTSYDDQNRHGFRSSEFATDSLRPKLIVEYYVPSTDFATHIRYSSDFPSLQEAIDSTRSGDILYIDRDYTLTSTIEINQRDVSIIGTKSWLQPAVNGNPSPLFRIVNSGTGADAVLWNTSLRDLRFRNEAGATGYGTGTAVEIYDDPSVEDGAISSIRLEDLSIENFEIGIHIKNAHNIFIENCLVAGNYDGLKCETPDTTTICGQIKLFGGYFINNNYHIHTSCVPGANGVGEISLFGWTCGHQRNDDDGPVYSNGSTGVYAECPTYISTFGSHYEDLDYAIHEPVGYVPGVNAFSNFMSPIYVTGVRTGAAEELALIGNGFTPDSVAFVSNQKVYKGVLIGANYKSAMRDSIIETTNGLIEMATTDSAMFSAFRIPVVQSSIQLPEASDVLPGTIIFVTNTGRIYIAESGSWTYIE